MRTRSRTDRAAGVVLAATGSAVAALAAQVLVRTLPDLSSADPHLAGDATMAILLAGLPIGAAGLLTLFLAADLWRGGRGARVLAAA